MGALAPGGAAASRAGLRRVVTHLGPRLERRSPRLRASLTRGLTVFVFHDVSPAPSRFQRLSSGSVSPEGFRRQILWIRSRFELIEPPSLPALGGTEKLPPNAALITFDDAWAGTFRVGLPILAELGAPSICFLNMGTVAGDPDLAAVRRFEAANRGPRILGTDAPLEAAQAGRLIDELRRAYGSDPGFLSFQGAVATADDLERAAKAGGVWFGSHLYHHWDLRFATPELCQRSLRDNAAALAAYPNTLPSFATPHGYAEPGYVRAIMAAATDLRLLFVATNSQNRTADGSVLDRLVLPPEPSTPDQWWYATHRRRLFGSLLG